MMQQTYELLVEQASQQGFEYEKSILGHSRTGFNAKEVEK